MKVIDLIIGMYAGYIPSTVSFNMYGDRYTAYFNPITNRFKIEDYNQDDIYITNYFEEIEMLDNNHLEKIKKEDLINHLVKDCGCVIEDTPKEDKKIPEKLKKKKTIDGSFEGKITYIYKYNEYEIGDTLNEIIDYLKSKGE